MWQILFIQNMLVKIYTVKKYTDIQLMYSDIARREVTNKLAVDVTWYSHVCPFKCITACVKGRQKHWY